MDFEDLGNLLTSSSTLSTASTGSLNGGLGREFGGEGHDHGRGGDGGGDPQGGRLGMAGPGSFPGLEGIGLSGLGTGADDGGLGHVHPSFGFTLSNGNVSGMTQYLGFFSSGLTIPSNASFTVDSSTGIITETLTGTASTETIQYTPDATTTASATTSASGATTSGTGSSTTTTTSATTPTYHITQDATVFTNPTATQSSGITHGTSFTISNGNVTGVQDVTSIGNYSFSNPENVSPLTSFAVSSSGVTKVNLDGNTIDTTSFVPAAGSSGLYVVGAELKTFIIQGSAGTALNVNPHDQLTFTTSSSGAITQGQSVPTHGSSFTVTAGNGVTFTQPASGYVLENLTQGTTTQSVLYYEASGSSVYTEVAHANGSTAIDVVGIQSQIAKLPTALQALL